MTEQRPTYRALSSHALPPRVDASSPLVQHYIDGTVARDTILLLPILVSPLSPEQPSRCLYYVHQDLGDSSFCNTKTDDTCACCTVPVCTEHSRLVYTLAALVGDDPEYADVVFCETCAVLSPAMRTALHAFIVQINSPETTAHHPAPSTIVKAEQEAVPQCQRGNCPWNASRRVTLQTEDIAFPTVLCGLIFPSRRATFDLCSGCYHLNVKRDNALQIVSVDPLEWPEAES